MRFAVVCLLLLTPNLLLAEATKEEIPTVSELTEGILAFNCYEKADDFFPIILTEDTNGWTAIGIPDLDIIREVDNGFAFKSSKNDLLLAFLKEEGDNWQLEYFDEDGLNAAKCLEADEFAETINLAMCSFISTLSSASGAARYSNARCTASTFTSRIVRLLIR